MGLENGKKAEDLEKWQMCVFYWFLLKSTVIFIKIDKFYHFQGKLSAALKIDQKIHFFGLAGLLVGF